jgi:hypothetical protein
MFLKITLNIIAEASKKRKDLSLQEKQIILECYDKLPKINQRSAAALLKISQPLLCKKFKNISDIQTSALTNENTDRKRARSGQYKVESGFKICLVMFVVKRMFWLMCLLCVNKQKNLLKLWTNES